MLLKHYVGITSTSKRSLNLVTSVEIRPGYHTFTNAILEANNFVKMLLFQLSFEIKMCLKRF